jgi:hypothetical protein
MIYVPLPQKNVYLLVSSMPPLFYLTSCIPTISNLYFDISFEGAMSEPAVYNSLIFHVPSLMYIFLSLGCLSKESVQVRDPL